MSLIINLSEVPTEGESIQHEIDSTDFLLPAQDGEIPGSINCQGQVFVIGDDLARFDGALSGKIVRECVRCLKPFEEDFFLNCAASFRQSTKSSVTPLPSKKVKKGSRRQDSIVDDEQENDIDMYPIADNQIDLLPALREHLILATPLQSLCHESCAGLCQACGANLNDGVCGCCSPVMPSSGIESNVHPMLGEQIDKHSSRLM